MVDGQTRRISWPTTRMSLAKLPGSDRDVVLIHGIEPNMRWRSFCQDIVGIMLELGVETAVLLGALLADAPHTRPVPVTGAASDSGLTSGSSSNRPATRGRPASSACSRTRSRRRAWRRCPLWAAVPHYVAQPPSPKATLALLRWVEDLLDVSVPMGDLPEQARAWERGVNELAEQDTEVAEYVRALEEQKDATELPEATGDAIAREFERYLRRRGGDVD